MDLKKLLRANYAQIFFVCAAFSLMVVIGSIFVGNIIRKESLRTVTVALNETEKAIRSYLREPKIAFDNIYTAVQDMLDRGESQDAVRRYLTQTTELLKTQEEGVMGFNSVYGYIRGEFISGYEVDLGDDYVPQKRPWYQLAIRSKGAEYTAPYLDADTKRMVMSLAQEIYGKNGDYYGVMSLDVDISWLMEYAETLQFADGGYGMIINQYLYTVAHPKEQYRNLPLQELGNGYAEISDMLREDQIVSAKRIRDIDNTRVIVFFKQLYNGWSIGVVMPIGSYFSDLYLNIFILAVLGIVLAVILSYILLRLSAAKMQSDEENKSKSSFLAHMSHEIRTPMNAILGMTELMLQKDLTPDIREDTSTIKQAGSNLLSIINNILDFSKIESERMEIVAAEYQFSSLINDVISIIRMRMREKHLLFVTNINSNLPSVLIGDMIRLHQILLNLLTNAAKYTQKGYVSLTVDGKIIDGNSVFLSFAVADTGIGIKESDIASLFGDFVRFDAHKNQNVEGTGLGLAISRSLCRLMGGDLTVFSRYGEGSIFTATLPQKIKNSAHFATVNNPETHYVLIYETRVSYANSIVRSLENLGVRCSFTANYNDFLRALASGDYSFVFAASFLFDETREAMRKLDSGATLVLLAEYGEAAVQSEIYTIAMPAHAISIANVLNGIEDAGTYAETESEKNRFIAPTARILIVDDIATNLQVAKGLLSSYGAQIDCCMSGRDAIGLVMANNYDLIFMDHMMPDMDGIETTEMIRSLGSQRFRGIPIVALTANAVSGMREMFLEKKFSDYLSKPIETKKLNEIMEKWIPKEKRESAEQSDAGQNPQSSDLKISGVDVDAGISMMGGSEEGYREVLVTYCRDAAERMKVLKLPDADELTLFTTQVHALKSASASIGAAELSRQAYLLEDAGRHGDMEAIRENLDSFRENLSNIVENILAALPPEEPDISEEEYTPIDKTVLLKLKEALEAEDIWTIDTILDEITRMTLDAKTKEAFSSIADDVLMSEFKNAAGLLDGLLTEGY